jgi:hypothetical protein
MTAQSNLYARASSTPSDVAPSTATEQSGLKKVDRSRRKLLHLAWATPTIAAVSLPKNGVAQSFSYQIYRPDGRLFSQGRTGPGRAIGFAGNYTVSTQPDPGVMVRIQRQRQPDGSPRPDGSLFMFAEYEP